MHSRIIALRNVKSEQEKSKKYELLKEQDILDYYDGNMPSFADYVADLSKEQTKYSYDWLVECLNYQAKQKAILKQENGEYFLEIPKSLLEEKLKKDFELFKEKAQSLTQEEFLDGFGIERYDLKNLLVGDNGGFHFFDKTGAENVYGCSLDNEMDWIRYTLAFAKEDDKLLFRLEGALDYHF